MTVSPEWPQDGNRRPRPAAGGASGDRARDPALPPTLFKLPNLNRDRGEEDRPERRQTAPPAQMASEPPPADEPKPEAETEQQDEAEAKKKKSESEKKPDPPPRAPLPPTDQPAGRSWMDTFGSHGMVVVLLLTVVSAALLSSRDRPDPSLESLAENEPVEEKSGEYVDLSYPAQKSSELDDSGLDDSGLGDNGLGDWALPPIPVQERQLFAQPDPAPVTQQPELGDFTHPPLELPFTSGNVDGYSLSESAPLIEPEPVVRDRPLVSLEPPQTLIDPIFETPGLVPGTYQDNQFLPGAPRINTLPASKRAHSPTVPTPQTADLPSLEQWFNGRNAPQARSTIEPAPSPELRHKPSYQQPANDFQQYSTPQQFNAQRFVDQAPPSPPQPPPWYQPQPQPQPQPWYQPQPQSQAQTEPRLAPQPQPAQPQPKLAPQPPSPPQAEPDSTEYQYSSTPHGIKDWSRYFPTYQPVKAARSRTDSTSR